MKRRISTATGTATSLHEERLHIRKRYAELIAKRGLPRHVTFREINAAAAKERKRI